MSKLTHLYAFFNLSDVAKPEPLVGWSRNIFFRNQQGRITQKTKTNYQKISKKNSKFFGAFYQTLGLWQIRSFEAGQKKSFV
jgi:hypothetical protein